MTLPALDRPDATVVAVGAHADDIEIGAGGTLLRMRETHPDARFRWLVCSAAGERADEARAAASAIGVDDVTVLDFADRFLPAEWQRLKTSIGRWAAQGHPADLVFAPRREDRHQDHRVVADIVWQSFRTSMIWAYEIPKWEGDLGQPNVFVDLSDAQVAAKIDLLDRSYPSQKGKAWFDHDTFRGLARLRGVESGTTWAEAFHVEKLAW